MAVHAGKLERWLGKEKIEYLQRQMVGWYGPAINLSDVPGSVWITADGDFVGDFQRGSFASAGSFALTGTDVTLTYDSAQIWTTQTPASTTWNTQSPASSTWTPQTPDSATWSTQSPASGIWTTQPPITTTWN